MKNLAQQPTIREMLERDDVREISYRTLMERRRARAALESGLSNLESDREKRMRALYERLGYKPKPAPDPRLLVSAAEAWMKDHATPVTSETAPTQRALQRLVEMDRLRLKATRTRLRELGIR